MSNKNITLNVVVLLFFVLGIALTRLAADGYIGFKISSMFLVAISLRNIIAYHLDIPMFWWRSWVPEYKELLGYSKAVYRVNYFVLSMGVLMWFKQVGQ